jgi:membrane protein required for colicin V production
MGIFDVALLTIIAGFGLFGLWFGLIHTIGSLLGTLLGAFLASRYYEPMADWLTAVTGWEGNVPEVVMFIIAFIVINRLVGFVFWILERVFKIITILPFISSLNRLLGAVVGVFEGAVTVGLILYFIERFPLSEKIMEMMATSEIAPILVGIAAVLLPLLPEGLKLLQSSVDYVEDIILN